MSIMNSGQFEYDLT